MGKSRNPEGHEEAAGIAQARYEGGSSMEKRGQLEVDCGGGINRTRFWMWKKMGLRGACFWPEHLVGRMSNFLDRGHLVGTDGEFH